MTSRVSSTWLLLGGALVFSIVCGAAIGWFASSPGKDLALAPQKAPNPATAISKTNAAPVESAKTNAKPSVAKPASVLPTNSTLAPKPTETPVAEPPVAQTGTNWQTELDAILASGGDDNAKGQRILAMLPNLPIEAQVELIQHATVLTSDDHYAPLGQMIANPQTSESLLSVLMADLVGRDTQLKLPTLLQLARTPNHPLASDAHELLKNYLEKDYSNNWGEWEAAVRKTLSEIRSEPVPENN
jgi:hypothetical protein